MFALIMFFLYCIVWPVGRWERSRVISCCGFYFSPWRHWGFIRRKDVLIWPKTKCFIKLQIKIVLWQKIYMNVFWFSLITIKYKFGLSVCLPVWLYPINVKTAEPLGPNFLWDHREGLWIIKISNICLYQNSLVIKF